jgi:predicted glutamine amidotransferase
MSIGIKQKKKALTWKFFESSLPYMSASDKDGLGYVAADGNKIFGERWLVNKNAFKIRNEKNEYATKIADLFGSGLMVNESEYNSFGSGKMLNATSILLHTRKATCARNITNTHPFVIEDTALIHNGVIRNDEKIMAKVKPISTCDSESILQEYLYSGVNLDPHNIQNIADMLDGWYACGIISKDKNNRQIVDVFKCDDSKLNIAWVKELDNFVLCTTMDILEKTAKDAKMTITSHNGLKGGIMWRFDAKTGEKLGEFVFAPHCLEKNKTGYSGFSSPSTNYGSKELVRQSTYNYHARGY